MSAAIRDEKGRLVAGHPSLFFKHKPGHNAGRPKELKAQIKDALSIAEGAMPEIIRDMIARARDKDCPPSVRQAASEYLCDRIYGKPNQPLSNKDGSKLQSFTFSLPPGMIPAPGGLFGSSDIRADQN